MNLLAAKPSLICHIAKIMINLNDFKVEPFNTFQIEIDLRILGIRFFKTNQIMLSAFEGKD